MKRIYVVAIIGLVISLVYFVVGNGYQQLELSTADSENTKEEVQVELSEKEAHIFRLFLKDDINSFASGSAQNVFGTGSIYAPVPIVTTADQMQNDYHIAPQDLSVHGEDNRRVFL